jgi:hypothetical protein
MSRVIQPTEVTNPDGSKVCMTSALASKEDNVGEGVLPLVNALKEFLSDSPEMQYIIKMVSEQRGIF